MRYALLLSLLAGCAADEAVTTNATELAAPPTPIALDASQLAPQQPARVVARVGSPNKTVYFTVSTVGTGRGPCPAVFGGACLDLRSPVLLGIARSDAAGVATLEFTVPAAVAGQQVWFQAAMARGTVPARLSDIETREVQEPADLYFPWGPDEFRAYQFGGLGYTDWTFMDLWWDNISLCGNLFRLGWFEDVAGVTWQNLDPWSFPYGCVAPTDGGGEAFAVATRDGRLAVLHVNPDFTTTFEDVRMNVIGLRWFPADVDTDRVVLPDPDGLRGWIVGDGAFGGNDWDFRWNNAELCMVGAPIGAFDGPGDIDPTSYAATPLAYDCYDVAEGGRDAFVFQTLGGTREVVWVEPGYTRAYEVVPDVNEIALRIVR